MLKRIALFTAVLLGSLALVATPASAAPPAACANSSLCGYVADQFDTSEGYGWVGVQAGACKPIGQPNSWTSVYNNGGRSVRMYKGAGCTGGYWTLAAGDSLRNMALYQPSWNDNLESVRWS